MDDLRKALALYKSEDLTFDHIARIPCSGKSLLYAIGSGSTIGLIRLALTRNPRSAGTFGVLSFFAVAIGAFEFCQMQKRMAREMLIEMSKLQQE